MSEYETPSRDSLALAAELDNAAENGPCALRSRERRTKVSGLRSIGELLRELGFAHTAQAPQCINATGYVQSPNAA